MKWTQTLLIPKSITEYKWMEIELVKIINGYDPGGYGQTYISIDWDTKKDFDMVDASEMISNTYRDFQSNLKDMRDESKSFHQLVYSAHRMDLINNFLSNWLIGYSAHNMFITPEFIPIWSVDILLDYLKDHKEVGGVWTVELYIHV